MRDLELHRKFFSRFGCKGVWSCRILWAVLFRSKRSFLSCFPTARRYRDSEKIITKVVIDNIFPRSITLRRGVGNGLPMDVRRRASLIVWISIRKITGPDNMTTLQGFRRHLKFESLANVINFQVAFVFTPAFSKSLAENIFGKASISRST